MNSSGYHSCLQEIEIWYYIRRLSDHSDSY